MKKLVLGLIILFSMSCIPLKNAPNIKDYDVVMARKFKGDLPKQYAFVFKDGKSANEFYQYIYWKLGRVDVKVEENLPFTVGLNTYYLSIYERPRESVTLNLLPIAIDAVLLSQGEGTMMDGEGVYSSEGETWYILITVVDSELSDSLHPSYENQEKVVSALKALKDEYENSLHYVEGLLKAD